MGINKLKLRKDVIKIFIGCPVILYLSSFIDHRSIRLFYYLFVPIALCIIYIPIKIIFRGYK